MKYFICLLRRVFFFFSQLSVSIADSGRDGTRVEVRFGFPAKRTSPFISAGVSVQSRTGLRGVQFGGERLYYR